MAPSYGPGPDTPREQKQSHAPQVLFHCLQGWPPPGPNHFRWHENGSLVFSHDGVELSVVPTGREWKAFWKVCDEVDVWSWPSEVGHNDVDDGLMYELQLKVGSRAVNSRGQAVGSPKGFAEKLRKFHSALQVLVGWSGSDGASTGRG